MKKIALLAYSFSVLLFACTAKESGNKKEEKVAADSLATNEVHLSDEQLKHAGIALETPAVKDMHTTIRVNGVVDVPPQNIVSVSFPMGGYLKSMQLLPGMQVTRGQVLAVLEDPQYIQLQEDYLVAKSKLRFLEADFARQKELNAAKANSDKVFQQVKSDYESQQVMVKSLGEKLQLVHVQPEKLNADNISRSLVVHAPISGYVTKVNVNPGKYVSATDVLFELINPADIHLSLTVFEKDVVHLAEGQTVKCYSNNKQSEPYTAKIHLVARNIGDNRASEVHCHFDKFDKRLIPGMFMNAEIAVDNAAVTAVPDDAVVKWENKDYLFVSESPSKFVMTPVETGHQNGGYTEIKTTLPDKHVVVKNAYTLLMKMKNGGEE
jgi:cobalt-zinc-cadmium efflux system membrane fusion protein